ncbi:hypothetical protein SARC_02014 [Sphaeroforma arctica JP610]|uniref:Uncharacterized protein n=1 Tax=Sphaeroforma arctica JP610 TaxID=667725 RepID=A0A0L0GAC1_9EUKA|nr:hypothetical protein SARC_02014 [Sphaeroforma arctica JP610]KNC85831.1 hypothetical protein SARC_02014 [Sphaeroforma arctica JP610]|eukprot:XP_014159733.1 hypothetical protein SARC_02014 [Sphaeroforma arctica JP610]
MFADACPIGVGTAGLFVYIPRAQELLSVFPVGWIQPLSSKRMASADQALLDNKLEQTSTSNTFVHLPKLSPNAPSSSSARSGYKRSPTPSVARCNNMSRVNHDNAYRDLESATKDDSDSTATGGLSVSEIQIVEGKVTETVKETVIKRKSTPRLRRRESVQFANRIRVVHTPVRVNATSKLSQVACGANTIYALSENGNLFVLPLNSLTEEPTSACLTLMNVDKVDMRQDPIIHVDCGEHHVVALTLHGKVLSAPQSSDGNKYGQLGLGHFKDLYQTQVEDTEKGEPYTKLHLLQDISNQIITRVACGKAHTLALTASGEVFGFGSDRCFQLGLGGWDSKLSTARHSPTYMTGLWPSGTYDGCRKGQTGHS